MRHPDIFTQSRLVQIANPASPAALVATADRQPAETEAPGWRFATVGAAAQVQQTKAARVAIAAAISGGQIGPGHYQVEYSNARGPGTWGTLRRAARGTHMLPRRPGAHVAVRIDSTPPVLLLATPAWLAAELPPIVGCVLPGPAGVADPPGPQRA